MTRRNFLFAITVIALLSTASWAQVPDKQKVVAGAERAFEKFTKAYVAPAPGCAAAVSHNGETVFEKAFGLADMEHNVPNTSQTIFESGSVAKQFTAAALVLLQQDGNLSIDDPVRKYIPALPDYGAPLTSRHLLNGNGGMLTTVGDCMKWNAMLDSQSLGAPLVAALETRGVLNDGRKIAYALGLTVDTYKGLKDVAQVITPLRNQLRSI